LPALTIELCDDSQVLCHEFGSNRYGLVCAPPRSHLISLCLLFVLNDQLLLMIFCKNHMAVTAFTEKANEDKGNNAIKWNYNVGKPTEGN
jgi:hypothetical protein